MAKPLLNPTDEAPRILSFDDIPQPREFLRSGGVPGVEYVYLLPEEQPKAQAEGWSLIQDMPYFNVRGVSMTIMAKRRYNTRNTAAQPGTVKCKFNLSDLAAERLGTLTLSPEPSRLPVEPEVSQAKFVPPKATDTSLLKQQK